MELILGYSIGTAIIFLVWIINVIYMYHRNFGDKD